MGHWATMSEQYGQRLFHKTARSLQQGIYPVEWMSGFWRMWKKPYDIAPYKKPRTGYRRLTTSLRMMKMLKKVSSRANGGETYHRCRVYNLGSFSCHSDPVRRTPAVLSPMGLPMDFIPLHLSRTGCWCSPASISSWSTKCSRGDSLHGRNETQSRIYRSILRASRIVPWEVSAVVSKDQRSCYSTDRRGCGCST